MPLPSAGSLSTDLIADEVGYTMSITHNLAGPRGIGQDAPGPTSLHYFYRAGNVSTNGVQQVAGFSMSAFYGQEAIYRCIGFTASNGVSGSATIVTYYKSPRTITFTSSLTTYCIRQNWDGRMSISNTLNATWSVGSTCSAVTGQSVASQEPNGAYGKFGVRMFNANGWDATGLPNSLNATAGAWPTAQAGSTWSNTWWGNPNLNSTDGRLNQTGLWNAANVPTQGTVIRNYVGWGFFNVNINVPQSRVYYVGLAGDNGVTIQLNGVTAFSQTNYTSTLPFNWWNIIPLTFSAGDNVIKLANWNDGGQGSLGIEVYGNTQSDLINVLNASIPFGAAPPNGLNLLYSSSNFLNSGTFFQNLNVTCPFVGDCNFSGTSSILSGAATTTSTTTTTTTNAASPSLSVLSGSYPVYTQGTNANVLVTNNTGVTVYLIVMFNSGGNSSGNITPSDNAVINTGGSPQTTSSVSGAVSSSGQNIFGSPSYSLVNGATVSALVNKNDTLGSGASVRLAWSSNGAPTSL